MRTGLLTARLTTSFGDSHARPVDLGLEPDPDPRD